MLESANLGDSDSLYSSAKDLTSEPKTVLDFFLFCMPFVRYVCKVKSNKKTEDLKQLMAGGLDVPIDHHRSPRETEAQESGLEKCILLFII